MMQIPGEEIIHEGINDVIEGRESINALLVSIGAPRLRRVGVEVPDATIEEPEHRLYFKLQETHGDAAHSKYNALIRRLVRLERSIKLGAWRTAGQDNSSKQY
ncbi:MAG TPA: hypothetical protein VNA17_10375 [Pyrinomonadaceae bacterium]|nr:hypothetical protein [Pyrinomonadaceae bacterium]